jgi:hypothetical protein
MATTIPSSGISLYNTAGVVVIANNPVPFNGVLSQQNVNFIGGTIAKIINPGRYNVSYYIDTANTLVIPYVVKNGVEIAGTRTGVSISESFVSYSFLCDFAKDDEIQLFVANSVSLLAAGSEVNANLTLSL